MKEGEGDKEKMRTREKEKEGERERESERICKNSPQCVDWIIRYEIEHEKLISWHGTCETANERTKLVF
tara:strand:+ start:1038 stop:1244 length:207 start_codon:yes stop_codon:yes gene_type:complete